MSLLRRLFRQSRGQTVQLSSRCSSASTRRCSSPVRSRPRYEGSLRVSAGDGSDESVMTSEVNEMRFVLFHDRGGGGPVWFAPGKGHLAVNRTERQPRLKD